MMWCSSSMPVVVEAMRTTTTTTTIRNWTVVRQIPAKFGSPKKDQGIAERNEIRTNDQFVKRKKKNVLCSKLSVLLPHEGHGFLISSIEHCCGFSKRKGSSAFLDDESQRLSQGSPTDKIQTQSPQKPKKNDLSDDK